MSTPREKTTSSDSKEVVRLKVEGAGTTVNTLRDQQTARGVSLVCPFPALEVDIPVTFGSGEAMRRGAIHRIGVEDDPGSGLPRLRLSVRALSRTAETRATVVSPPGESLLGEASRATPLPEEVDRARTDLDVLTVTGDTEDLLDELLGGRRARPDRASSEDTYSGLDSKACEADPAWAAMGELTLPGEISGRSVTRRRKRLAAVAVWVMVAGMVAGGAFVLDRAGVVSLDEIRLAGLDFLGKTGLSPGSAEEVSSPVAAEEDSVTASAAAMTTGIVEYRSVEGRISEEPAEVGAAADEVVIEASRDEGLIEGEEAEEAEEAVASAESAEDAASDDEAILVLPTRWPAEYSTAYRLRDPNGVVVDVPGGLVRREGWVTAAEHPMIRSVRAVQRESGARFVVYVNGDLPRFATSSLPTGVQLRLYREDGREPLSTEQVAMAD